jgi:hypothetical protein
MGIWISLQVACQMGSRSAKNASEKFSCLGTFKAARRRRLVMAGPDPVTPGPTLWRPAGQTPHPTKGKKTTGDGGAWPRDTWADNLAAGRTPHPTKGKKTTGDGGAWPRDTWADTLAAGRCGIWSIFMPMICSV